MGEPVIYIDPRRARELDRGIVLQKIYYRPEGYYRTAEKMRDVCKKTSYNFLLTDIKDWLNKQAVFQIHKPPPRYISRVSFNTIQIPNKCHQADILYMPYDKIGNRNFKHKLVIKDVATRYRKSCALTNKSASTVAKAIRKIYKDPNNPLFYPNEFTTDKGTEYLSECQGLLLSYGVRHKQTETK